MSSSRMTHEEKDALVVRLRERIAELEDKLDVEKQFNDRCRRNEEVAIKLMMDANADLVEMGQRIDELEAQNLNMMALFRDFYELEFNRDECWEIIKKYGGDA